MLDQTEPLDEGHDAVCRRAHVVRRDAPDGRVEAAAGRTDAEEQGYLDEEDYEGADAGLGRDGLVVSLDEADGVGRRGWSGKKTYRQMILITRTKT